MISLVLLFGCAPMALSDDEEMFIDGGPSPAADDGTVGGGSDTNDATVQGWQTNAEVADGALEAWGVGVLEARRLGDDVACAHTGMTLPCGELGQSAERTDEGVAMTYDVAPAADGSWCAWSATYTLTGLSATEGVVTVGWTVDGVAVEGTSTRAAYGSVAAP